MDGFMAAFKQKENGIDSLCLQPSETDIINIIRS